MKKILLLLIVIFSGLNCFSQEKPIEFTDHTSFEVINTSLRIRMQQNEALKFSSKLIIKNKEFIGFLTGIGKAVPPLDEKSLIVLGKKNKSLARQIKRINSAYEVTQNDSKYYFAGLNSINFDKFNSCSPKNPCKVKCQTVLIQLSHQTGKENILILKSFKMIQ